MKNRTKQTLICLLLVSLVLLSFFVCGCSEIPEKDKPQDTPTNSNPDEDKPIDVETKDLVTLVFCADEGVIKGKDSFQVERGKDALVEVGINDDYCIDDVKYDGGYAFIDCGGTLLCSFTNVKYNSVITIKATQSASQIRYNLNGGSFILFVTERDVYSQSGKSNTHLRKNTDLGTDKISREGYTQIGWNTQSDGKGQHVGLGSRVTVGESEKLALYAEWAKWTDKEEFTYSKNAFTQSDSTDMCIEKYCGDDTDLLVIPEVINGGKVTRINANFAVGKKIKTLVMSDKIGYVGENKSCSIDEIYLTDAVTDFSLGGFGNSIKTIHLNACRLPAMNGVSSNAVFAESIDRLIVNYSTEKNNLILFAGCSLCYGINCKLIDDYFKGEYVVTDVGINGDINMFFQFECIEKFIKAGDVFIHAPETASEFSLFQNLGYRDGCDWMLFACIETNYDLLSLVDASSMQDVFSALRSFNQRRADLPCVSYENVNSEYNVYGDCVSPRTSSLSEVGMSNFNSECNQFFISDFLTASAFDRLNECYEAVTKKGAAAFYSYSPVNFGALEASGEDLTCSWIRFDTKMHEALNTHYVKIISSPADYIFKPELFYDTDYHLTTEGAVLRTERLIEDIAKALGL